MRRRTILALLILLIAAPLAACKEKDVARIPEKDRARIEKDLERDITAVPPAEDQEGAETRDSQGSPEEGVPPSPGSPEEGGF